MKEYLKPEYIEAFIKSALQEDIGDGDHSTLASVPAEAMNRAHLIIKDEGIIAGLALAEQIFKTFDPTLEVQILLQDGDKVKKGDIGMTVKGKARSILTTERLVLNCLQRMSGIATHTNRLVQLIKGTKTQLLDTRKTTPNFRIAEKWAVSIGGGSNHRFALYDMIMLKDNHIDYAGGIAAAMSATKKYLANTGKNLKIEVETRTLEEVREAVQVGGMDFIMLDNMSPDTMREALKIIDGKYLTEASGGITEATLQAVAACGVDYISVGALTHQVNSLDMSLKAY
ncbi:carboxylating nicotinate-nucleotide diphosphorylase [Penaeicola halotolerans]|uniref:carboxylating nicotinate-nucleotide diphosphorylase n=1 Tax=Penaeicola halotolerans TaxID=2793196 RepID=UPI001CF8FF5D|nr:carboxylating nicotinate-nucleotide diphosphorylase [Penaeicola halotolerans]